MEDYKKKYETALENLKWIKETNKNNSELVNFIEFRYPELKENWDEDGRIRESLLKYLKESFNFDGEIIYPEVVNWIAWVEKQGNISPTEDELEALRIAAYEPTKNWSEKLQSLYEKLARYEQGEQTSTVENVEPKFKVGDTIRPKGSMAEYTIESISGGCYHGKGWGLSINCGEDYELVENKPADNKVEPKFKVGDTIVDKDPDEYNYETIKDIKDGKYIFTDGYCTNINEQEGWQLVKTSTIIEPRFKVGDWVIWDNKIPCHVDNIYQGKNSLMYTITDTNNMNRSYSVKGFDNNAHLWTIQDAKDGDILTTKDAVFIFKHMDKTGLSLCRSYCEVIGNSGLGLGFDFPIQTVHPATIEQGELLFSNMNKAGYVWDAEKKELKKIEQDQLEPKFKSGDWIVCNNTHDVYKILCVIDDGFSTLSHSIDDNVFYANTENMDKNFHLWTIEDAKPGDILANKYGAIFINTGISKEGGTFDCYCYVSVQNEFCIENYKTGSWFYKDDVKPATKEQRNLLFQKMKEAGYEWNAEKKELKDIKEQNPTEDNYKISDWDIKVATIEYNNGYECGKQRVLKYPEDYGLCKKPSWSEEDERMFTKIEEAIKSYYAPFSRDAEEMLNWFKSLEGKVHLKQKWSEEDERICQCLIKDQKEAFDKVNNSKYGHSEIISDLKEMYREHINWLESIKSRIKGNKQ